MFAQGVKNGVMRTGGERTTAPAKKVTGFAKCEMYAIQFGDENGQAHQVVVMRAGNEWYMPPNAEQWAQSLKPLAPWLVKELAGQLEAAAQAAPKEDTVDVLSAEAK